MIMSRLMHMEPHKEQARTITNILQPTGVAVDMTNNILFIC